MHSSRLLPLLGAILCLAAPASAVVVTSFYEDWESYGQDAPDFDLVNVFENPDFLEGNWVSVGGVGQGLWSRTPLAGPGFGAGFQMFTGPSPVTFRSTAQLAPGTYIFTMRSVYSGSEQRNAYAVLGGVFLQNNHPPRTPGTVEQIDSKIVEITADMSPAAAQVAIYNPFQFSRFGGARIMEISVVPVPEASALALLLPGLAVVALILRRRR